jgi:hypothetical protein
MKRWMIAGGLSLILVGCGHKQPAPVATPTVSVTVTTTATATETVTPTATPSAEPTQDPAYVKLRDEAKDLALGKGYQDALPKLKSALEMRKDDPEVYFYMMICQGNLEESPSTKSEAYADAKKVLELGPTTDFAGRAKDYIIAAESEPKKPAKDLEDETPIEGGGDYKLVPNGLYTTQAPTILLESDLDSLTPDLKKELWWSQVHPDAVPAAVSVPKGTKVSIKKFQNFFYSKNTWRGDDRRDREAKIDFDANFFALTALDVFVADGPLKGKHGWMFSQMDRFRGVDKDGNNVWAVKTKPAVLLDRIGAPARPAH